MTVIMERFNRFIEKWMAFVAPTCLILGVCFPQIAKHGVPYVPFVFAFMTFVGALKSTFQDVGNVFRNPKLLVICLGFIHVVLPLLACGLGHLLFPGNDNIITGMVLEFTVPTAVVGLMWVTINNGNSPLSLSLVVLDTILAPFVIPAALHVLLGSAVTIDSTQMVQELVVMVAIPAVLAMCINQASHGRTRKTWPKKLAPYSKLALIFVITSNSSKIAPYVRHLNLERIKVAGAILLLACSGYVIGWMIARFMRQRLDISVSMMYGIGMRNISAGAVIAGQYFPAEVVFPVMIGTLFQQVLAAIFGKLFIRNRIPDKF